VANLRLKYALDKARQVNMPGTNVERAIKKGCGDLDGAALEETSYEGYGPGGVAVLVEVMTDNRNRTVGEIRNIFEKRGGNLGTSGCVAWMFEKKGVILVSAEDTDEDSVLDIALEAGAENVETADDAFEITCPPEAYDGLLEAVQVGGLTLVSSELSMVPQSTVPVDGSAVSSVIGLLEALDDHDDVQEVHSNADLPDEEA
jgi:YebC/PmpR family DNA-binding regulatory protein